MIKWQSPHHYGGGSPVLYEESNSTLPDITLLPMLADFFCVTINDLFELDIKRSTSEPCEDKKGGVVGGRYG